MSGLVSGIMELDGTLLVSPVTDKVNLKKQTNSTATSLSRNHYPLTEDNQQSLLGAASWRDYFFLYHCTGGSQHLGQEANSN